MARSVLVPLAIIMVTFHFIFTSQGKLSDVYGRKPLLLASYIVPAIGYLLTGFSGSLILLIVARIPSGNYSIPIYNNYSIKK